jgi:hypothetical protein
MSQFTGIFQTKMHSFLIKLCRKIHLVKFGAWLEESVHEKLEELWDPHQLYRRRITGTVQPKM